MNDSSDITESELFTMSLENFKSLTDKYIRFHRLFLEEFIRFCQDEKIDVVIVEGDYHPSGYSEENLELNKVVRQELMTLANDYGHVKFVPRKAAYEVKAEHFRDGTHVKAAAGLEFTRKLLGYMERSGSQGQDQEMVHSLR